MRITFVIFLFLSSVALGQIDTLNNKELKKNNLTLNIGSAVLWNTVGIQYQRLFYRKKKYSVLTIGQDFNRLFFWDYFVDSHITSIKYGIVTEPKNLLKPHHFEINGGIAGLYQEGDFLIIPVGNLGYRHQYPDKKFIFRTGIGVPELIYLSFGFKF